MKKLFLILFLLISAVAFSQTLPILQKAPGTSPNTRSWNPGSGKVDTAFGLPAYFAPLTIFDSGYVMYNGLDSSLYVWTKYQWRKASGSGGTISGSGIVNRLAKFTGISAIGPSAVFTDSLGRGRGDSVIDYRKDFSSFYTTYSLITLNDLNVAIAGVVVGSGSDLVNITMAALDALSGSNTSKTYYITDPFKQGFYRYTGIAADQSTDNQGLRIITPDLKIYDRWTFDGKVNPTWFVSGTFTPASVVGSADTAVGTDYGPPTKAAQKAAVSGQTIVIYDNVVFHTQMDSLKNKQFIFQIDGTLHANKKTLFYLYPPDVAGADKSHIIRGNGQLIGQENLPLHNKTTHDNGTGPNWAAMTWNAFEIGNCSKNTIEIHKITGFKSLVEFKNGGGLGTQENSIAWQWVDRCAHAVVMTSTTGSSFCDKNTFTGINGGTARVDAGLMWKADGNAAAGYTGSFQQDKWVHVLGERIDSIMDLKGLIREPKMQDCWTEMGLSTGVLGSSATAIICRTNGAANTNVINFILDGCAFYYSDLLQNGLGQNATITNTPIYNRDLPAGNNAALIGANAEGDVNGNLIVLDAPANLSRTNMNKSPAIFKFRPSVKYQMQDTAIVSSTYSVADNIGWVKSNNAAATITLPNVFTNLKRFVQITNLNASPLTISNLASGQVTTLPGNASTLVRSDTTSWFNLYPGSTGSGSSPFTANGLDYYNPSSRFGFKGVTSPTAAIDIGWDSAANKGAIKIRPGALRLVPENYLIENDGSSFYITNGNIRRKLLDDQNTATVINKTFTDIPTIYSGDGTTVSNRIVSHGSNFVRFSGSGDLQKFGGLFRTSAITAPTTGTLGLTIGGSLISGQVFNGTSWINSDLQLGTTSNNTFIYGTLRLFDNPLGTVSGGMNKTTIGLAGQIPVVNNAGTAYVDRYPSSVFGAYHETNNADITAVDADYSLFISNLSTNRNMNLPNPASYPNRVLTIGMHIGNTNTIFLNYSLYTGTVTGTSAIVNENSFMIQSDGAKWQIIQQRL